MARKQKKGYGICYRSRNTARPMGSIGSNIWSRMWPSWIEKEKVMNSWSRRLSPVMVTGIILVLILSACGTSSTGPGSTGTGKTHLSIMVGGLSKQIYLPNMLAKRLGYFDQAGLDVTLIDEASGQSSETAVLAGPGDAGSGSYNHTT